MGTLEADLTACPSEIRALDANAETLWLEFLRRTGISMSVDRKTVIDGASKRAWVIRNLGVPSLIQRLSAAKDEIGRARVWWREAASCGAGDSIPDLSPDSMSVLNPFIVTKSLKFKDTRLEKLRATKAETEVATAIETLAPQYGRHPKYQSEAARNRARKAQNAAAQRAYRQKRRAQAGQYASQ